MTGGPPGRSSARLGRHEAAITASALAALSVAVQWLSLPRPLHGDPLNVFEYARDWPEVPPGHQAMRIGLMIPSRVAQEALGYDQAAYVLTALLLGVIGVLGTYAAGRVLLGQGVGVAAAVLLLTNPIFTTVDHATGQVLPDIPSGGLIALGLAGLVAAGTRTGRRRTALLLLAGLALGWAYLVREFAVLAYPVAVAAGVWAGLRWRQLLVAAVGALVCLGVDVANAAYVYGDPLARLSAAQTTAPPYENEPVTHLTAFLKFFTAIEPARLSSGFLLLLALLVVAAVVVRDRRLWILLGWFASFYLPFSLLSGGLDPERISLRAELVRYWYVAFPPLFVGGVGGAVLLWRRLRAGPAARTRRGVDVVAGLAATGFVLVWVLVAAQLLAANPRDDAWNEFRAWAQAQDRRDETLWVDTRGAQTAGLYLRRPFSGQPYWTGAVESFPQRSRIGAEVAADGLLLETLFGPRPRPHERFGWTRVWTSTDRTLTVWER